MSASTLAAVGIDEDVNDDDREEGTSFSTFQQQPQQLLRLPAETPQKQQPLKKRHYRGGRRGTRRLREAREKKIAQLRLAGKPVFDDEEDDDGQREHSDTFP